MRDEEPARRPTITIQPSDPVNLPPPEVWRLLTEILMRQATETVRDNGDGTYTHTWTFRRDDEVTPCRMKTC